MLPDGTKVTTIGATIITIFFILLLLFYISDQVLRITANVENSQFAAIVGVVAHLHDGDHNEEWKNNDTSADKQHVRVDRVGRGLAIWPGQSDVSGKAIDGPHDNEYLLNTETIVK